MNKIASQSMLVLMTGAMITLYLITLGTTDQETWLGVAAIVIIVTSVALERIWPFRSGWNESKADLPGDITFFVVVFAILDPILKWLTPFVLIAMIGQISGPLNGMPLWAEVVAVTLIIELFAWLSHYLHHNVRWLWPFHAVHHSPERVYTVNNFRFHPVNHIINHLFIVLPLLLIGFSAEAILAYTAASLPILLMQHSNADFDFGRWNAILNTNQVHRWHHSCVSSEGNRNYGRALLLFDLLFGTYYNPTEQDAPEAVGLYPSSRKFPKAENFWKQLWYPFTAWGCPHCCSQ